MLKTLLSILATFWLIAGSIYHGFNLFSARAGLEETAGTIIYQLAGILLVSTAFLALCALPFIVVSRFEIALKFVGLFIKRESFGVMLALAGLFIGFAYCLYMFDFGLVLGKSTVKEIFSISLLVAMTTVIGWKITFSRTNRVNHN